MYADSRTHILNKDTIFTIATSALQQVDKELQNEKKIIQHLEDRIINLENLIEKQGNDIKELYNIIQNQNRIMNRHYLFLFLIFIPFGDGQLGKDLGDYIKIK